jgi:glycosyltransferase involved in cell wall biosynthesis
MKKIKLIIFPGNFLPYIGGLETHIDEFVKYLALDKNYNITIFTPNIKNVKEKEVIHDKRVKVIRYPAFEIITNWAFPNIFNPKFWKTYFSLYKQNYNVVMTRTRFFSNSFLGVFFAKFRFNKIKLIHVEHGSEFVKLKSSFFTALAYIYDQIFGNLVFYFSDRIVAISEVSFQFVVGKFLSTKNREVKIIKRGVDIENLKTIKDNNLIRNRFKDKIILVSATRLFKWKGIQNNIIAYKNLDPKIQEKIVYIVVGDGEYRDHLEKLSSKYYDNGIYFEGAKDFKTAMSYLKTSDIYLHSSYKGGALSSSLLQAMYYKCFIIASPNEGADEVVDKENGILLKNNSSNNIKKAITDYVKNREKFADFPTKAKKDIVKNFKWEKSIKEYKKLFESL